MLAIITLASLVTIFTFLYKLVKTLAKFVKFIFKTKSRGKGKRNKGKRNKKTNSSIMKTLVKVYLTIIQISKAFSSPQDISNSQLNQAQYRQINWADRKNIPQHMSNPQLNQAQYPQIKWAARRSVPTGLFIDSTPNTCNLFVDSSQNTSNQNTSNTGSSHIIGTSNPQGYIAQTNAVPAFIGSIE